MREHRLLVTYADDNHWTVRNCVDGTYCAQLTFDEMLGHMIAITFPAEKIGPQGLYGMRTYEQIQADDFARLNRREEPR